MTEKVLVRKRMVLDKITGKLIPVEKMLKRIDTGITPKQIKEAENMKKVLVKTAKTKPKRIISIRIGNNVISIPVIGETAYKKLLSKLGRIGIVSRAIPIHEDTSTSRQRSTNEY